MPALNFIKVSLPESSLMGWLSCKLQAKQTEAYQTIAFSHDAAQKNFSQPLASAIAAPRDLPPPGVCLALDLASRAGGRPRRISRGSRRVPRCRVGIDPGQLPGTLRNARPKAG